MFSPAVEAVIPDWKAKKQAQWDAFKDAMPGLQLAVSGQKGTQYTIVCSPHDGSFYEAVVIGQLPQIVLEQYGSRLNPRMRDMADAKKPYDKKSINLTDNQVAQIIATWKEGRSALTLPFVEAVSGADGKLRYRT